jgi:uncharacterized protein
MRVLVLVLLAVIVVWLIRRAWRRADLKTEIPPRAVEGELVACARCGLNLPRAEARMAADHLYCSEEHARLGPRGPAGGG